MTNLEDMSVEDLKEDIGNSESVDYLLLVRREVETRTDMPPSQKLYFDMMIEQRVGYLVKR